jgi:hypothetical protein
MFPAAVVYRKCNVAHALLRHPHCVLSLLALLLRTAQAAKFQRQGTQLRKKMWWQNFRMQIIVVGVVLLLVVVVFLLACFTGGKNCVSKGGSSSPAPGNAMPEAPAAPAGLSDNPLSPTGSMAEKVAAAPGAPPGLSSLPGKLLRLML